ncbi:MAG: HAMP domain-containing protein [Acidobacteria bacterium]|nr:HAMP domain-containing protein [Acidobacteriota bacterium]
MIFRAIRVRLTVWYLAILVLGLGALSIGSWFAMRASLFHAIDHELEDRIKGVEKFMNEQIASLTLVEIRDEFREHSVLGPGGDLFQVCNRRGEWLYRSLPLENNRTPIRTPDQLGESGLEENLTVQKTPVRFSSRRIVVRGEPYTVQVATPLPEFYGALQRFSTILLLSVPVLILVASVGGYWISTRALRPVEEIRATAESISIRNLSERLTVPDSGDELQRLSETLNAMLARLSDSVQRMSQFTADASHELRAPISLIRTTAELALQRSGLSAELTRDLKQVVAEAGRTSRLVESLLLLARADTGEDGLHKELTDWSLSVQEAVEQASRVAKTRNITVHLSTPDHPLAVFGDLEALRRLAFILLDNAIKYSPESSVVRVSMIAERNQGILSVADSGIGINAEDREHVFDRFWRADKARSRGLGGAGLGLSIAKWIVDSHQGTIRLTSEAGSGTTFEVQIPLHVRSKGAL